MPDEPINFKTLREKAGLTLDKLAELSGYSIATINGLELHNEGSARLRSKLISILSPQGISYAAHVPSAQMFQYERQEQAIDTALAELTELQKRAKNLEAILRKLKK